VQGQDVWEYRRRHAEESAGFDAAMTSVTSIVAASVLGAFDFGRFREIVDIGGGRGGFIAAVLTRWPQVRGVLFDQPHVVADAPRLLADAGVAERCRVVAGSFFDAVPSGSDAYLLKDIVHDWPDEHAIEILRVCRRAMDGPATLLIVERVIPRPNEGYDAAFSDLNMLVMPGGQERTGAEYATLVEASGFRLIDVTPTSSGFSVIEAVPA
jgi:hypothetical protein